MLFSTPAAAEGGATAEHLYSILEDTLKSHNIPKDNSDRVVVTMLHDKFKETYTELLLCFLKRDYVMKTIHSDRSIEIENTKYWLSDTEMYLDPVLSVMPALSQRNALSSEYRKTNPSIMHLILSLPRVSSSYRNNFQDLDDKWRKIPILKDNLPKDFEVTPQSNDDTFWSKLLDYKNNLGELEFKILPKFALEALSLPHSNADCERMFSKINNVKTKFRNKLLTETIEKTLLASEGIKFQGGCPSFNPSKEMLSKMTTSNLYKERDRDAAGTSGMSGDSEPIVEGVDIDDSEIFF
ncbi:hypothetical protein J6590_014198 [Homalodisca vitripennis]|nr:hypothetical protein J6590_014198 [Homalodisca vitripennis]